MISNGWRSSPSAGIFSVGGMSGRITQYDLDGWWMRDWRSMTEIIKAFGYSAKPLIECCEEMIPEAYGSI